jgi:hypothetical protein
MGEAARRMNSARMFTLTAPHVSLPLAKHLAALRKAFGLLRKSPEWKRCVVGGLYAIECTRNESRGEWHPHVHALCDGTFFPHEELRRAWRRALNAVGGVWNLSPSDPLSIDAELIRDRAAAAKYVAKYLCKPSSVERWRLASIAEFARAMHGGRLLHTFGNLHGANLDPADPNEAEPGAERVASLPWVTLAASKGNHSARVACALFRLIWPTRTAWVPDTPPKIPDGAILEAESVQDAFCRHAAKADREFWADVGDMHRGRELDPHGPPKPPPPEQTSIRWGTLGT